MLQKRSVKKRKKFKLPHVTLLLNCSHDFYTVYKYCIDCNAIYGRFRYVVWKQKSWTRVLETIYQNFSHGGWPGAEFWPSAWGYFVAVREKLKNELVCVGAREWFNENAYKFNQRCPTPSHKFYQILALLKAKLLELKPFPWRLT